MEEKTGIIAWFESSSIACRIDRGAEKHLEYK